MNERTRLNRCREDIADNSTRRSAVATSVEILSTATKLYGTDLTKNRIFDKACNRRLKVTHGH